MKRLLFVDNDRDTLRTYLDLFDSLRDEWQVVPAKTTDEAWDHIRRGQFDVVVLDPVPGEKGAAEFLVRLLNKHPGTVRLVLASQTDRESVLRLLGPAHQYLTKPCPPGLFLAALQRNLGLQDLLANEQLKRLVSQMQSLPSMPSLYLELLNKLSTDDPSVDDVARIISRDLGMCTKMLQLVNSAYFGLPQTLSNPEEAVMYLGVETVKALVLSLQIFALFERTKVAGFSYEALWNHCWRVGAFAKKIAIAERLSAKAVDHSFTAGLLHDVGKLILVTGLPSRYCAAIELQKQKQHALWQAEQEIFGASHAEVGAYLLGLWGLPNPVVEAVGWHHRPAQSGETTSSPLLAVHVANALDHDLQPAENAVHGEHLHGDYLIQVSAVERLEMWRERCVSAMSTPGEL